MKAYFLPSFLHSFFPPSFCLWVFISNAYTTIPPAFIKQHFFLFLHSIYIYGFFLGSPFCPRPAAHSRVNFTITLDYLMKTSWPKANSLKGKPAERLIHLVDQCSQTALRRGSKEGSVEADQELLLQKGLLVLPSQTAPLSIPQSPDFLV